jgi:hypothetical protein
MYILVLLNILLFDISFSINTKHLSKNNIKKSYQESYLCQVIKQRQKYHLIQYSNSKNKQPYKKLYIPESKNCR